MKTICKPQVNKFSYMAVRQQMESSSKPLVHTVMDTPAMEEAVVVWSLVQNIRAKPLAK